MLQANPNLTWRDVKYILAQTAKKTDPTDADWTTNAAGYHINHKYGFGAVLTARERMLDPLYDFEPRRGFILKTASLTR